MQGSAVDSSLLRMWLRGAHPVPIIDEASLAEAREAVRQAGAGLAPLLTDTMVLVMTELARNQLVHGQGGEVAARRVTRGGVDGLEIIAADRGPGIPDPEQALCDHVSTAGSLGIGLPGTERLCDEIDLDVRWGEGCCVWARKFSRPPPYLSRIGILGRALRRDEVSGDHAGFVRGDSSVTIAIADGLGKGAPAQLAAGRAVERALAGAGRPIAELMQRCDEALAGTRGAVMALAELGYGPPHQLTYLSIGDITLDLRRKGRAERLVRTAGVLGLRQRRPPQIPARMEVHAGDTLLLYTDGITTQAGRPGAPIAPGRHPIVAAQHVLVHHARPHDDALVVACRV